MCGLSLIVMTGGYSLVTVCGLLTVAASLVAEHGLYGWQASVVAACGLSSLVRWNLPRAGIGPVSPALAGRPLTTGPLGKS